MRNMKGFTTAQCSVLVRLPGIKPKCCTSVQLVRSMCVHKRAERSTVFPTEIEKFRLWASDWWIPSSLQRMNVLRVPLVRDGLLQTAFPLKAKKSSKPLEGFHILDIGCGGGYLSEPLARLGAQVTGLDPCSENIEAAKRHSELDEEITGNLSYVCDTVENLKDGVEKFDAVVCSEVVEHVNNVPFFIECCVNLVKDGGSLFFTTINRTALSYLVAIVGAEYITRDIPIGTHNWHQFVTPDDLQTFLKHNGCQTVLIHGMFYNPLTSRWSWCNLDQVSYALHAVKRI